MANRMSYLTPRFGNIFFSRKIKLLRRRFFPRYRNSIKQEFTEKVNVLNIEIDNLLKTEVLENLHDGIVFTPNVDHLMKLQRDQEFLEAYSSADYKLCDSQILIYASRFLGNPIKEKISGSDFFPAFYNFHKKNEQIKIFLLGAAKGVADQAQERINTKVRRNIVVGNYSPTFGFEKNEQECKSIVKLINDSGATVLAVGLGAPKQEKWIYKYKEQLPNIKIFLAIGATIDFEAGNIQRAPVFISNLGFEWLYRMLCEPQRLWKRYLIEDVPFLWLILQQKLNFYQMTPSEEQSSK
ncbi:WecB/TagA/CpsF family glycosyltransferase [Tolypothrix sp. PCC 7910]|uniref:WecB/TagA/CpsF family glycosyltransferase n=1 Tax=Tolypothrix sp. PCC 7910 TaxID=2099387 RepID=UPI0014278389|nr:WecB/TagA/CpsF family glycosyltransferase [Tolypothrix sp. PCC 7910]QIR37963.1 WecB/TagA/CpsF family glycosyltransferase [Tolypothrix sp. PCC 7910]